jgi:hypothetical protein
MVKKIPKMAGPQALASPLVMVAIPFKVPRTFKEGAALVRRIVMQGNAETFANPLVSIRLINATYCIHPSDINAKKGVAI